eukprot:2968400-Amphidinium_carterae.2
MFVTTVYVGTHSASLTCQPQGSPRPSRTAGSGLVGRFVHPNMGVALTPSTLCNSCAKGVGAFSCFLWLSKMRRVLQDVEIMLAHVFHLCALIKTKEQLHWKAK